MLVKNFIVLLLKCVTLIQRDVSTKLFWYEVSNQLMLRSQNTSHGCKISQPEKFIIFLIKIEKNGISYKTNILNSKYFIPLNI